MGRASTKPSPANQMMADVDTSFRPEVDINLGVGYVNEDTIPRHLLSQSLDKVLANPQSYPLALNYGGPNGTPYLIESIRRFYHQQHLCETNLDVLAGKQILIGASGATSLLDAIASTIKTGIVLTADPIYYIFADLLERLGFDVIAVPEDQHGIRTEHLQKTIESLGDKKKRIRFMYIVTVNNPTCSILSNQRRQDLVRIASNLSNQLRRKVPLVLDTAYEMLIHDSQVQSPQSSFLNDRLGITYEIGTLSKILAPALRIGYMIGPTSPLTDAVVQRVSDVGFSAPVLNQAMASYLLDHHIDEQLQSVHDAYRKKALRVRKALEEGLGDALEECRGGSGGFYYYLTFKKVQTHTQSAFFQYTNRSTGNPLIDGPKHAKYPKVAYVPGEYCVHNHGHLVQRGRRQFRLSYAFENTHRIEQAVNILNDACQYAS